jgi:predicted metal-dependent phosphoesterase TrpH
LGRIPDADAVEVYNSKHLFGLENGRAKLEAGRRGMTMVAGSDSHLLKTMGLGVTEIDGDVCQIKVTNILPTCRDNSAYLKISNG